MSDPQRVIYDVTMPLGPRTPTWPGDPPLAIEPAFSIAEDGARVSRLELGTHSGTHVDAPAHLLAEGKDVTELDLQALVGPALVVYLPRSTCITGDDLASFVDALGVGSQPPPRFLLKTSNSDRGLLTTALTPDYVALTPEGAAWLVEQGAMLVGIDALSVDRFGDESLPAHRVLLMNGIVVVEGLDLREVSPGLYDLICLPLRIVGGDGAPARALLVRKAEGCRP